MKQSAIPSHLPDHLVERFQFAKDWWHDDVTHFTAALYTSR